MFLISAWTGKHGERRTRGAVTYWTGTQWGARLDDAAQFQSLAVAKRLAQTLATAWQFVVGVDERVAVTGAHKSPELALQKHRRKYARRTKARAGVERRANPVPLSRRASLNASRARYANFRGDAPGEVIPVRVPTPKSAMTVGELDGVLYTTERDGKIERYQHKFRKKSRPLLAASDDGKSLHIVGGQYEFTERGIVDT